MQQIIAFFISLFIFSNSWASWFDDTFIDPADGQLDLSNWLLNKKGLLPVPIIITEPAIGYGGGLALAYFHDNLGGGQDGVPPSISVLGAAGTQNGTWFAGGGHLGIWKQDHLRYKGFAGTGLVKMDFYGISGDLGNEPKSSLAFETEAVFLFQELEFRLWESNFFAGVNYTFVDTQNTFKLTYNDEVIPDLPGVKFDSRSAALGLILEYDSRNNILSPSSGTHAMLKTQFFNATWGSDDDFNRYSAYIKHYLNLSEKWLLGLRADAKGIDGDAPFYSYPFIEMRGIKAMRYQGQQTLLGEAELDWTFIPRWTLVGFAGAGKAYGSGEQKNSDLIIARGIGFRYLIASKLGLKMGLDIARGPEDTAFYIQVGSAWAR